MNSTQSNNQNTNENSSLKFIATMIKFLEGLNVSKQDVEKFYNRTFQTLGFDLHQGLKPIFLYSLDKVKNVSVDDQKKYDVCSYIVAGVDFSDNRCLFQWKIGEMSSNDAPVLSELMAIQKVEVGYLVYLDSGKEIRIEVKQTGLKKSSEVSKPDKLEEEGKKRAQVDTMEVLGSNCLDSLGLTESYGKIEFKELFNKLVNDPDNPLNRKWIDYFGGSASKSVKKPCMVAMRNYFTKYSS